MPPRPAPDLTLRRDQVTAAARSLAETAGWSAVTMRRIAAELGMTQPVLYTAFAGRQALVDAVALAGFGDLAAMMHAADATPMALMRAYLRFATENPRTYEAMFSLPLDMRFATEHTPEPLRDAFRALREVFPDSDGLRAELAWATLHGLATLHAGDRLLDSQAEARLQLAHVALTRSLGASDLDTSDTP